MKEKGDANSTETAIRRLFPLLADANVFQFSYIIVPMNQFDDANPTSSYRHVDTLILKSIYRYLLVFDQMYFNLTIYFNLYLLLITEYKNQNYNDFITCNHCS